MHAHLEDLRRGKRGLPGWIVRLVCAPVWLVRVYRAGDTYEGRDPYINCVVARARNRAEVELEGVVKPPTADQYRAVVEALIDKGFVVKRERYTSQRGRVKRFGE